MNPFAQYASIIYGEAFSDRQDEIAAITNRILRAAQPGCIAIVGPPRIGKSSLAYHMLIRQQKALIAEHLIPIWCPFATIQSLDHLFRLFVQLTQECLDDYHVNSPVLQRAAGRALEQGSWSDLQHNVQRFFKVLKHEGWRVAIVLDEFDAARQVFQQNPLGFQALRSLADSPEWRVAFVTCSRRSIPEIEVQSGADISNFHNIFHYLYLKPFVREAMMTLLGRLALLGIRLTDEDEDLCQRVTGGHPFLVSALGFFIAQSWLEEGTYSLEQALQQAQAIFIDYYDDLARLLQHDQALEKLLQILFGPVTTATTEDAERFVRYGLLCRAENGLYKAFSEHFGEYLRITERSFDLWPLWKDTERKLRVIIFQVMEQTYKTSDWPEALERARPKLKAMLDDCRSRQADEQRRFGARASTNLLDYTYPGDLYQIIRSHWISFHPFLQQTEQYWEQRFNQLSRIRNPVAHNRDEVLALHERQVAEGYCREILYRLSTTGL